MPVRHLFILGFLILLAIPTGINRVPASPVQKLDGPKERPVCGTERTEEVAEVDEMDFSAKKLTATKSLGGGGTIPVYFHLISPKPGFLDIVSDQVLKRQIDVMNRAYSRTGWTFRLAAVNRLLSVDWGVLARGDTSEFEMKASLRRGGSGDLNVFVIPYAGKLLGWATFPCDYERAPKKDGIVLAAHTLPGISDTPFNLGMTLVHETGHWMGLYHTFQGQCRDGDFIADTPAEAEPHYGACGVRVDTCPHQPGFDSITNFMNYSDDRCLVEFTPGQIERMRDQFRLYRQLSESSQPLARGLRVVIRTTDLDRQPLVGCYFGVFAPGRNPAKNEIKRDDFLFLGKTNENGIYDSQVTGVRIEPGQYRMRIVRDGYEPIDAVFEVREGSRPGFAFLVFRLSNDGPN